MRDDFPVNFGSKALFLWNEPVAYARERATRSRREAPWQSPILAIFLSTFTILCALAQVTLREAPQHPISLGAWLGFWLAGTLAFALLFLGISFLPTPRRVRLSQKFIEIGKRIYRNGDVVGFFLERRIGFSVLFISLREGGAESRDEEKIRNALAEFGLRSENRSNIIAQPTQRPWGGLGVVFGALFIFVLGFWLLAISAKSEVFALETEIASTKPHRDKIKEELRAHGLTREIRQAILTDVALATTPEVPKAIARSLVLSLLISAAAAWAFALNASLTWMQAHRAGKRLESETEWASSEGGLISPKRELEERLSFKSRYCALLVAMVAIATATFIFCERAWENRQRSHQQAAIQRLNIRLTEAGFSKAEQVAVFSEIEKSRSISVWIIAKKLVIGNGILWILASTFASIIWIKSEVIRADRQFHERKAKSFKLHSAIPTK